MVCNIHVYHFLKDFFLGKSGERIPLPFYLFGRHFISPTLMKLNLSGYKIFGWNFFSSFIMSIMSSFVSRLGWRDVTRVRDVLLGLVCYVLFMLLKLHHEPQLYAHSAHLLSDLTTST